MEQTLVLVKPDGVQRGLIGEIIARLEKRGLKLVGAKLIQVADSLAREHYAIHIGKPFYEGLIQYITAAPVMAMVWEGENSVNAVRQTMGSTDPVKATPGTIRHDFALLISRNLTHASDSPENARNEISLWFEKDEIVEWQRLNEDWITGGN
ncbi:MAG: nucleoside-diphosphate kinase [Chloroflexi bacterium 44-23]|nr:MAG: nucleoside-diphosphate kinase [Chloroflexi bacterium 44-23]